MELAKAIRSRNEHHSRVDGGASAPTHLGAAPVPSFLYGTAWKETRTAALVHQAFRAGMVGLDTANQRQHYFEAAVGEAVAAWIGEGHATRQKLFLQTKFTPQWKQDHRMPYLADAPVQTQVAQSLASSLDNLRTGYIDSYLLHRPSLPDQLTDEDWQAWEAICQALHSGDVLRVGISHFSSNQLAELLNSSPVKPAFVQNPCNATRGWDRGVRRLCREHGVLYQAYALVSAKRQPLNNQTLTFIAARKGCTSAQVAYQFALQTGMIPITGTGDLTHLIQALSTEPFRLDEGELNLIETSDDIAL